MHSALRLDAIGVPDARPAGDETAGPASMREKAQWAYRYVKVKMVWSAASNTVWAGAWAAEADKVLFSDDYSSAVHHVSSD